MKTYGTLTLDRRGQGQWAITDLAPHVAIAFKRLFPRVPATATTLHLSDTDEIRADLLWFTARYPLATTDADELAAGAQRVADRLAERDRILLPTWAPGAAAGFQPGMQPYVWHWPDDADEPVTIPLADFAAKRAALKTAAGVKND